MLCKIIASQFSNEIAGDLWTVWTEIELLYKGDGLVRRQQLNVKLFKPTGQIIHPGHVSRGNNDLGLCIQFNKMPQILGIVFQNFIT